MSFKPFTNEELEEIEAHGFHVMADNPDSRDILRATIDQKHTEGHKVCPVCRALAIRSKEPRP